MRVDTSAAWKKTGRVLLLLLAVACSKAAKNDPAPPTVAVRVARAEEQSFTETVSAIGVVAGRPGSVASLAAPAPGRIAGILVAAGSPVAAGAPLIRLEPATFRSASGAADAALLNAQSTHDRVARLVRQGIMARKELEQATSDLEQARANAANARRQQELATIRAPIGGVVTRVSAALGAMVDPSQVLVEIVDPRALDLLFGVTPSHAALVRGGARVVVRGTQDLGQEPLGVATVTDVGEVIDPASRGVTVRAQAPTTRRPLRIGETIFGEIALSTRPRAVVVPAEALVPDGEGFRLFVVDALGMARARPVVVGARTKDLVEITSGLQAGERVVTYGAYGIEDSARVSLLATPDAVPARP